MVEHELDLIEFQLPGSETIIRGRDIPITAATERELELWSGRKEWDPLMLPTLEKYWDGYYWTGDISVPWSAVFISYLLEPFGLKGDVNHVAYVKSVINGESSGWQAHSIPKNQRRIQLNVGDVLVRKRSGSPVAGHGDIVYKIENNRAFLAGGNMGNTAKTIGTLAVSPQGVVTEEISNYKVILKKKPVTLQPRMAFLAIPIGLSTLLYLRSRKK